MNTISVVRGDSYSSKRPIKRTTVYVSAGVPLNLAGCTVRTTIRSEMLSPLEDPTDSKAAWKGTLAVDSNGNATEQHNIFMIGPASAGTIEIRMYAYDSRKLPNVEELVGDIQITEPSGEVYTLPDRYKIVLSDGITHRVQEIKPTLLLSPSGSFDSKGAITPSITGGVIEVQGMYGKAWQVAEATTNLLRNPRLLTSGTAWTPSNVTRADDSTLTPSGRPAARYTVNSSGVLSYIFQYTEKDAATAGVPYSGRIMVKPSASGRMMRLQLTMVRADGTQTQAWQGPLITSKAGEWQELKFENVISNPETTHILFLPRFSEAATATAGDVFYVGDAQLEQKPYATPYADGSLGQGHAWTGAAHASTSTRTLGVLKQVITTGQVNDEMGTMVVRFHVADRSAVGWERIASIGVWNNSYLSIGRENTAMRAYTAGEGGEGSQSIMGPAFVKGYNTAAIAWGPFGRRVTLNGVIVGQSPIVTNYKFNGKFLESGFNGQSPSGPTESIMLFDRPLTTIEIERITSLPQKWTMENTTSII